VLVAKGEAFKINSSGLDFKVTASLALERMEVFYFSIKTFINYHLLSVEDSVLLNFASGYQKQVYKWIIPKQFYLQAFQGF
jgi:hypothetical protein